VTDWLGFRAAIVAAIEAAIPAAVLATTGVAWQDGPRPHARHRVLLSIVSSAFDDRDSALSTGGIQTLESMAVIVVQVTCESTYDSADADALWLIEQLRLGLRKVRVQEALVTAGIRIQVFPRTTRNIGGVGDQRALSVHAIEFTCCATFTLVPDPAEDAGLIEHVEAEAVVLDVDGSEIEVAFVVDEPPPEPDPEP
jgi:hypothetical protein